MNSKPFALACLLLSIGLTGCQTTQTPYEVRTLEHYKKGRSSNFYNLGVTEEKVNDRIYHVTVKLAGTSSQDRAKDMFYLHAANLTMNNNFEKFVTEKRKGGKWCYGTKTYYGGQVTAEEAGPKFSGFVLLLNDEKEVTSKQKVHIAKNIKKMTKPKVEAKIDEATMLKNEERYLTACERK